MDQDIEQLKQWIAECGEGDMVFFGGAGVSTESGIPDFRSEDGLYAQKAKYSYPPEYMLSRSFFDEHPAEFFDFYCDTMLTPGVQPNAAHRALAELEKRGVLRAVITQNIDNLHQEAGSENVLELHGGVNRNTCMSCGERYSLDELLAAREQSEDGVPRCSCGGIIKPDVVLYEEPLDSQVLEEAIRAIQNAKLLMVAGTSLAVYPAAGLLRYFRGDHLVIVNRDATPGDKHADLCLHRSIGEVLSNAIGG